MKVDINRAVKSKNFNLDKVLVSLFELENGGDDECHLIVGEGKIPEGKAVSKDFIERVVDLFIDSAIVKNDYEENKVRNEILKFFVYDLKNDNYVCRVAI